VTLDARLAAVAAERDRLRDALEAAHAERASLRTGSSEASSAQARLQEALARESSERSRLADAFAEAQATLVALEHGHSLQQHEATERAAELATVRAELVELRRERDDAQARLAEAQAVPPIALESLRAPEIETEPEPEPAPEPAPVQVVSVARVARIRDAASERPRIAVVDVGAAWAEAAVSGHDVVVVAPDAEAAAELARQAPVRIVLNLAAPGALPALAALRAAGIDAPVWGCIADPEAGRGLALGLIEPTVQPLDPDAIVAVLGPRLVRGSRVITVGADVDALMSLRQALARKGMSVSMAWDAKQAVELLGVVRPHAVVVDLDLTRRDGYAIAARLATLDTVPHAVLVGSNADAPRAFTATLNAPAVAANVRPLAQLLGELLARSEAPVPVAASATDNRPRIRAVSGQS
jgi:CheY-like chemotaxis protein